MKATQSRHYSPPIPGDKPYRGYAEYLRHPRFLEIRAQVFERAGGKCERCGERPPTEPHHLRYPPWGAFDVTGEFDRCLPSVPLRHPRQGQLTWR